MFIHVMNMWSVKEHTWVGTLQMNMDRSYLIACNIIKLNTAKGK